MSYLQSWIPCYFIPKQRHNREGLHFHAGGPSALFKGAVCVGAGRGGGGHWRGLGGWMDCEGRGDGQMHVNIGNGLTFHGLPVQCKDSFISCAFMHSPPKVRVFASISFVQ